MARSSAGLSFVFVLVLLGALGVGAYMVFQDLTGPSLTLSPETGGRISPAQELTVTMKDPSGIRSMVVSVRRGTQSLTVTRQTFNTLQPERSVTFNLKEANLPEGAFELEAKAYDGSLAGFGKGNTGTGTWSMFMDATPPRIAVKTLPPGIRRGGAALIAYTVSEEARATGVYVGKDFFPGHRQQNGQYLCLFPFPYSLTTANFVPEIMAQDMAGNVTSSRLLVNMQGRTFPSDTMKITDSFLESKAEELGKLCPEQSGLLAQYVCVNNKERIQNDLKLLELGRNTASTQLWEGNFQRLPRSAMKANFGDFRTYTYNNEKIDEQTHTGFDLASVLRAPVPASNKGRVIFAAPLGIYGNLVVIDHGLGLMTIYSHLSEIAVKEGDTVASGQEVGKTGVTGLAGGDHVHFGVLVGGIPVQPAEWLDPNWVKNNVTTRMNMGN